MASASPETTRSTVASSLVGIAVGTGVLALYLAAGLLVARWSVVDFLAHLTVGTARSLAVAGLLVVATFAVPVALYLRYRLVSPVALLAVVLLGWFGYGHLTGVLSVEAAFGLAIYVFAFSPLYLLLSLAFGGAEYYVAR